jgi:RNA recognition motif-containing protein
MNIYVGNLSKEVTEDDLREAFEPFGQLTSVKIIRDKFTNESRGFGFIEMPSKQEAESAIEKLIGTELKDKSIIVNEARERSNDRRNSGMQRGGGRKNRY